MASDGGGVAARGQGRGFGSVRGGQLADCLCCNACLHVPSRHIQPVHTLPVLHCGVCALSAFHGGVCS